MRRVVVFILSLLVAFVPALTAAPPANEKKPKIRGPVLAAVEKELDRLSRQIKDEAGPDWPRPSSEVAFMLLTGLAAQGSQVKRPTAEDLRQFGIAPSNKESVQLFTVAEDARIVI